MKIKGLWLRDDDTFLAESAAPPVYGWGASAPAEAASIIPDPGAPGISPNVHNMLQESGDYTNAAGHTLYATGINDSQFNFDIELGVVSVLVYFDNADTSGMLTNNGTLWATRPLTDDLRTILTPGAVTNTGEIVAQIMPTKVADIGSAIGIEFYGGLGGTTDQPVSLNNSGEIFATASYGFAAGVYVIESWRPPFINSGLIAAQSDSAQGRAFGIDCERGVPLQNLAGGSILAEGSAAAIAVYMDQIVSFSSDFFIANAGLIEAVSVDPDNASVGIYLSSNASTVPTIDNSGTISADFAIYSAVETNVTNEASGVIDGAIEIDDHGRIVNAGSITGLILLSDRADTVTNTGTIMGPILTGEGNDVVDNTGGVINSYTDLGYGDDQYIGGSGDQGVIGNRGDDVITGGPGQDLFLGGYGDDTLTGAGGSDGLYGEYGNDTINAGRGDYVSGGDGNDRIVLSDFGGFAGIDGGAGFDTLALAAGSRILDLKPVLAAGTVTGIDDIALGSGNGLVVRPADVLALSDNNTLEVQGDSSNRIYLLSGWTAGADQVIGGVTYHIYSSGGSTLLVQDGVVATIQTSVPAGAAGFDAGSGIAPPTPNPDFLASPLTVVNFYSTFYDLTIFAGETWESEDGHPVFAEWNTLDNYGSIKSETGQGISSALNGNGHANNYGLIEATGLFDGGMPDVAIGVRLNTGSLYNGGTIQATSASSNAWGVESWSSEVFTNDGSVIVETGALPQPLAFPMAVGVMVNNNSLINHGLIQVTGPAAWGVQANYGILTNTGTIIATSTSADPSIAIEADGGIILTNSGTIQGGIAVQSFESDNAIHNTGTIEGIVDFGKLDIGQGNDEIDNSGTMTGPILFGPGKDLYNGQRGALSGVVFGQADNDTLLGGDGNDAFDGGKGNDVLSGGKGIDTASYQDATAGVTVSLAIATAQNVGGGQGSDTLTSIEALQGSDFADHLTDRGNDNLLAGGAGDDTLNVINGGNDTALGGDGDDTIVFRGTLTNLDTVDGGNGNDTLVLQGDYSGDVAFRANGLLGVETISLVAHHSYNFTMNDGNVAAGATLTLQAKPLLATDSLVFDGSHETDGAFAVVGGRGNDTITGGAGNDVLSGRGGTDHLTGGAGADHYVYTQVSDSTGAAFDTVTGFDANADAFDLPFLVKHFNAPVTGALSAASFDTDLAHALGVGQLSGHHALLFAASSGTYAGDTFLVVDMNNVAGYQAGHDLVIMLDNPVSMGGFGAGNFI